MSQPILFVHDKHHADFWHCDISTDENRRKAFTILLVDFCAPGNGFEFFHHSGDASAEVQAAFQKILDGGDDAWTLNSPVSEDICLAEWITGFQEDYDNEGDLRFSIIEPLVLPLQH